MSQRQVSPCILVKHNPHARPTSCGKPLGSGLKGTKVIWVYKLANESPGAVDTHWSLLPTWLPHPRALFINRLGQYRTLILQSGSVVLVQLLMRLLLPCFLCLPSFVALIPGLLGYWWNGLRRAAASGDAGRTRREKGSTPNALLSFPQFALYLLSLD
jgi:hypothetical protein